MTAQADRIAQLEADLAEARRVAADERRRRLEHFEAKQAARRQASDANAQVEALVVAIRSRDEKIRELEAGEADALTMLMEAKAKLDDSRERIAELEETVEALEYRLEGALRRGPKA